MKKRLLFITSLLLIMNVFAQKAILFDLKILQDTQEGLNINTIEKMEDSCFQAYSPTKKTFKKDKSYWLKFKLLNKDQTKSYYITSSYILYKRLDLYYYIQDSLYTQHVSLNQPFTKKPIYSHENTLELPKSNDTLTCYIRLTCFWDEYVNFTVIDTQELLLQEARDAIPEFFFLGMTFIGMIISLLLFIYLKEKTYLFYILYSISIIFTRMIHSGYIYNFTSRVFDINYLHEIYNLYSISYVSLTVISILYFKYFLGINKEYLYLNNLITYIIILRIFLLIFYIFVLKNTNILVFGSINININLNHKIIDFMALSVILPMIYFSFNKHKTLSIIALLSSVIILVGNMIANLDLSFFNFDSYTWYINFASIEVVFFVMALGYRYHYLKKENENALLQIITKMKENEHIKDSINRELESKVAERTEEIRKINELLGIKNTELAHEVEDISAARLFQKNMNYEEFTKIFKDDDACYKYIANIKWSHNKYVCIKCGNLEYKEFTKYARRCKSCTYIESPINGTLFHNTKFSLQKAFYITYIISTGNKEKTFEEYATELNMRMATFWVFKQKILSLIEKTKSRKKHKDGWTHLIEYSMK